MTALTSPRRTKQRLARVAMFGLLALAAALCAAPEARAQWVTSGSNTTTTNNVGVGTTAPANQLHVNNTTGVGSMRVSGNVALMNFKDAAAPVNSKLYQWRSEGGVFRMSLVDDSETVMLHYNILAANSAGNVGIGTDSPRTVLQANGSGIPSFTGTAGSVLSVSGAGTDHHWGIDFRNSDGVTYPYPLARIATQFTSSGTNLLFGTSNSYASGVTNSALAIRYDGNVGIGTTTPTASRLHVYSPGNTYLRIGAPLGSQSSIAFNDDANGQDIVLYRPENTRDFSIWTASASNVVRVTQAGKVGIGTTAPTTALHVVGDVTVTGNISAKYQDVAEWVPSTQSLAAGTVVALDTERANHVVASASAYDTRVAGVISAQPGLSLGERGEGKVLVATTGRVKIKVNAAHAPIRIGDLLVTSDVPGVAMKSEPIAVGGRQLHAPGTIIGKALESLEKGTGEILVLLSLQ